LFVKTNKNLNNNDNVYSDQDESFGIKGEGKGYLLIGSGLKNEDSIMSHNHYSNCQTGRMPEMLSNNVLLKRDEKRIDDGKERLR
jgi:hypothetical protein